VHQQWPYVRAQVIDDAYLARVLELMLAVIEGRPNARPLEVSGLGYVNLLHIAVTLAAIPDSTAPELRDGGREPDADGDADAAAVTEEEAAADALALLEEAADDAEAE